MEIKNGYYRISIKALILDETRSKFLLVQEDNGKWELPGGDWIGAKNLKKVLGVKLKKKWD